MTELYTFQGTVINETLRAYLIKDSVHDGEPFWVPKSQTELYEDGSITIPAWLAKKRGMI